MLPPVTSSRASADGNAAATTSTQEEGAPELAGDVGLDDSLPRLPALVTPPSGLGDLNGADINAAQRAVLSALAGLDVLAKSHQPEQPVAPAPAKAQQQTTHKHLGAGASTTASGRGIQRAASAAAAAAAAAVSTSPFAAQSKQLTQQQHGGGGAPVQMKRGTYSSSSISNGAAATAAPPAAGGPNGAGGAPINMRRTQSLSEAAGGIRHNRANSPSRLSPLAYPHLPHGAAAHHLYMQPPAGLSFQHLSRSPLELPFGAMDAMPPHPLHHPASARLLPLGSSSLNYKAAEDQLHLQMMQQLALSSGMLPDHLQHQQQLQHQQVMHAMPHQQLEQQQQQQPSWAQQQQQQQAAATFRILQQRQRQQQQQQQLEHHQHHQQQQLQNAVNQHQHQLQQQQQQLQQQQLQQFYFPAQQQPHPAQQSQAQAQQQQQQQRLVAVYEDLLMDETRYPLSLNRTASVPDPQDSAPQNRHVIAGPWSTLEAAHSMPTSWSFAHPAEGGGRALPVILSADGGVGDEDLEATLLPTDLLPPAPRPEPARPDDGRRRSPDSSAGWWAAVAPVQVQAGGSKSLSSPQSPSASAHATPEGSSASFPGPSTPQPLQTTADMLSPSTTSNSCLIATLSDRWPSDAVPYAPGMPRRTSLLDANGASMPAMSTPAPGPLEFGRAGHHSLTPASTAGLDALPFLNLGHLW